VRPSRQAQAPRQVENFFGRWVKLVTLPTQMTRKAAAKVQTKKGPGSERPLLPLRDSRVRNSASGGLG
jgi:hypothetical protein